MSEKVPQSRVQPLQPINRWSSCRRVFWVYILIVSCIHRCSCCFTDAISGASCTASLYVSRVQQGTLDHQTVARYKRRAITPRVHVFPFLAVGIHSVGLKGEWNETLPPRAPSNSQSFKSRLSVHFVLRERCQRDKI